MKIHPGFIGCDVCKHHLDIFEADGSRTRRIDNSDEAIAAWLAGLPARPDRHIVFEATGRYDRRLAAMLQARGLRFSRVNPARARDFARALGVMAKTDRIDARVLAAMGQALDPAQTPARDAARDALAGLHKRRDQLVAMRQKEKVRLADAGPQERTSLERHLGWLDAEIAEVEAQRDALVSADAELARLNRLLRSIPGIGPVAAATLLALMPELGTASPKALAALAGLAPFNVDSGRFRGHRTIRGGRRRVRNALYMAAVSAWRSKTRLGTFAQTLIDRGKPFKLAMIALARKILLTANAILRDQIPFHA